jgi:hypothetical protein
MTIQTIKFSQFANGGDLSNGVTTVGLDNSLTINTQFNNPWTFLPPGTTGDRPTPVASIYYRLRLNTTLQVYEYYDPIPAIWVELSGSGTGTVNPGVTNDLAFYPANGTVLSPISAAANSVLVTNSSSVPSLSTTLPSGLTIPGATITSSTAALTSGQVAAVPSNPTDITNKAYVDAAVGGDVTSITGTTNQVIASSPTGAVTLSLPQDIATGSSPTFSTITLSSTTAHAVLIGEASSPINSVLLGAGQVLIGTTSGNPAAAAIGSGQNILVANSSGAITVGFTGNLPVTNLNSGTSATSSTFWRGDGTWAVPAGTGVTSVSGTLNRITSTGGTTPVIDIAATYVGQTSITTLGTIGTGTWQGTVVSPTYGGTGVNNGASTITIGGSHTLSGAFASTFTFTNTTSVTFPTSGTLATVGGTVSTLTGTANQVLVNGTSGSATSGAITLTTPQDIATTSNVTFGSVTSTNDATIHGLTVGLGTASVSTNTVLGSGAFTSNVSGANNVIIGYQAATSLTTSGGCIAIGQGALATITSGASDCVAIGKTAMSGNTAASCVGIGTNALAANTGVGNTACGHTAGAANTSGVCTAFGYQVASSNTTGTIAAFGYQAGNANVSGTGISCFGYQSLKLNTGNDNSAFGYQSLASNVSGIRNSCFGSGAGASMTGSNLSAFGYLAGNVATGDQNCAFGRSAYSQNTSGTSNSAFGYAALQAAGTWVQCTAVGASALNACAGNLNSSLGYNSLSAVSSGTNNTALGANTGGTAGGGTALTTGTHNTFLGYGAGTNSASSIGTLSIGYQAVADIATGATSSDNGPGIAVGSSTAIVGFRGDGTVYPTAGVGGGTLPLTFTGYWRIKINGTYYKIPLYPDA